MRRALLSLPVLLFLGLSLPFARAQAPLDIRPDKQGWQAKPELVKEIVAYGSQKARKVAQATMDQVRAAIRISTSDSGTRLNSFLNCSG